MDIEIDVKDIDTEDTQDVGKDDLSPSPEMMAKAAEIHGVAVPDTDKAVDDNADSEDTPVDKKTDDVPDSDKKGEANDKSDKDAKKSEDGKDEKAEAQSAALKWRREQAIKRMGWTEDDLKAMPEEFRDDIIDKAADALDAISNKMADAGRQTQEKDEKDGKDAPEPFDPDKKFTYEGVEDAFDNDTRTLFFEPTERQFNAVNTQIGKLQEQIAAVMPYVQSQLDAETARDNKSIETFFTENKKEFGDIFGQGASDALAETSQERHARDELIKEAAAQMQFSAQRDEPLELTDALNKALLYKHSDRIKELAVKEKVQKYKRRQSQITHRSTGSRSGSKKSADDRALDATVEAAERMGIMR